MEFMEKCFQSIKISQISHQYRHFMKILYLLCCFICYRYRVDWHWPLPTATSLGSDGWCTLVPPSTCCPHVWRTWTHGLPLCMPLCSPTPSPCVTSFRLRLGISPPRGLYTGHYTFYFFYPDDNITFLIECFCFFSKCNAIQKFYYLYT